MFPNANEKMFSGRVIPAIDKNEPNVTNSKSAGVPRGLSPKSVLWIRGGQMQPRTAGILSAYPAAWKTMPSEYEFLPDWGDLWF